jgi:hypothetical protein
VDLHRSKTGDAHNATASGAEEVTFMVVSIALDETRPSRLPRIQSLVA